MPLPGSGAARPEPPVPPTIFFGVRALLEPARTMTAAPTREREDEISDETSHEPSQLWNVVVWNDPVNLMSYVVWVFRKLFGHPEELATKLMLQVHHEGRAIVTSGARERAEMDVYRLHHHGLWATLERA